MSGTEATRASEPGRGVRIFQSYGWHDATDIARRLKDSLAEAGFDVWLDREQLRGDDKHFSLALEEAVSRCEVVVALLSPHSVRGPADRDERSSICYNELRLAEELSRPIVPVRVHKLSGPPPFLIIKYRRIDWLDWEQPDSYQKGLSEIVATIGRVLDRDKNLDLDIAFQATNFAPQLRTARDDFVGRDWLFARLDRWLDSERRCFAIEGATGNGKTAIVAELVRRNPGGRILAYHFCSAIPVTLDPAAFVRSVAGMLAASIDGYADLLWNGKLAAWLTASDPQTMLSQGVLAPLHQMRMDGRFYLVVDALDEAIGAASGISVPHLLAGALEEFPDWLKLLVTTRPHARIQRMFRTAEVCVLDSGAGDQRGDVGAYIAMRLAEPALAASGAAGSLIEQRAGGSFQYAGSVLDALASGEIDSPQLDQLPSRLEDFYYTRAERRFPNPPDYAHARVALELLLAAREPMTMAQLAALSGLDGDTQLHPALDALTCFVSPVSGAPASGSGEAAYGIPHKSIVDWLLSAEAGRFRIDPKPGRARIVAYCRDWRSHREPYALKHFIGHLLEEGLHAQAMRTIDQGLFAERLAHLGEPRLDAEDSRNLALALVAARDKAAILALSHTENTWQRDGIAAALQSTAPADLEFVDLVTRALLELKP